MFPKLDRIWQIPAVYCLLLTALALATPPPITTSG